MLMSFGRSKHRLHTKDKVNVTFEDVAGIDEAKEEVTVELTEVAVPIPVTIKASTIRIYKKAEE